MIKNLNNFHEVRVRKDVVTEVADIVRDRAPQVIAITGPSNSGKSTLAKELQKALGKGQAALIHLVDYWLYSRDEMKEKGLTGYDWEARDRSRILSDLAKLKAGESIEKPIQDKDKEVPSQKTEEVKPAEQIIIEAALDFREIADLIIFTHAPDEILIERRKARDGMKSAFGQSPEKIETYMREVSLPDYHRKLAPLMPKSDIIIDTNKNQVYLKNENSQ